MNNNLEAVSFIIEPFKKRYIFVVAVAVVAAIFESIGYYSLIPLLDLLVGKSNVEYELAEGDQHPNHFAYEDWSKGFIDWLKK